MFDSIKENMKRAADERAKKQAEEQRQQARAQAQAQATEQKIASIRVITGDVRYQYVIIDTLRAFSHYVAEPGEPYDPTAATQMVTRQMQELAVAVGADAVIHAQYQIVRYYVQRRGYNDVPAYEAHLFGTAIRIVGPPPEWASRAQE